MLAKSKHNSIETLVSQALIDMEISHEEFNAIIREKQKYKRMKENMGNVNERQENMRLDSVDSRKIMSLRIIYVINHINHIVKNNKKLLNIYAIKKKNHFFLV